MRLAVLGDPLVRAASSCHAETMTWRVTPFIAALVCLVLTGCTSEPPHAPTAMSGSTTTPSQAAGSTIAIRSTTTTAPATAYGSQTSTASPASVAAQVSAATDEQSANGASEHLVDSCDNARATVSPVPVPGDLTTGEFIYQGGEVFADLPVEKSNDGYFYKMGAALPAKISATVTITGTAASFASIITENGPSRGSRSVTYSSCPAVAGSEGVWWVGGFALWGRQTACVTVEVRTSAHPAPQRAVISLGAGTCTPA